jgi:hypothetical protein
MAIASGTSAPAVSTTPVIDEVMTELSGSGLTAVIDATGGIAGIYAPKGSEITKVTDQVASILGKYGSKPSLVAQEVRGQLYLANENDPSRMVALVSGTEDGITVTPYSRLVG